jgi:hypothetical protein
MAESGITWRLDAYAPHWLPLSDLHAVTQWMDTNGVEDPTAAHPVVVEDGTIRFEQDRCPDHVPTARRRTTTVTLPLLTVPPEVYQPTCGEAAVKVLTAVFEEHEWSAGFGGVCVTCSDTWVDGRRILCHRDGTVPWPCMPIREAMAKAGVPLDPPVPNGPPMLVFGDTLSPEKNAIAFGSTTPTTREGEGE